MISKHRIPLRSEVMSAEDALSYFADCAVATLIEEVDRARPVKMKSRRFARIAVDMIGECRRHRLATERLEERCSRALETANFKGVLVDFPPWMR